METMVKIAILGSVFVSYVTIAVGQRTQFSKTCTLALPVWGCINPKCYLIATQGPCGKDQMFMSVPANMDVSKLSGGALGLECGYNYGELVLPENSETSLDPDLERRHHPVVDSRQTYGYCVWSNRNHPCFGLPANYRYSTVTKRCHRIFSQAHCPKNQAFYEYYEDNPGKNSHTYGQCDCYPLYETWYDPKDGNCYPIHSQGTCPKGQWLAMQRPRDRIVCQPTPCPADGKHVLWTEGSVPQCYHRGTKGPCLASDVLALPNGVLQCSNQKENGPFIFTINPRRSCDRNWQSGSKLWQTQCTSHSKVTVNPCGSSATYSPRLRRCVYSYD